MKCWTAGKNTGTIYVLILLFILFLPPNFIRPADRKNPARQVFAPGMVRENLISKTKGNPVAGFLFCFQRRREK